MAKKKGIKTKDNKVENSGAFIGKVIAYTTISFILTISGISLLLLCNYLFFMERYPFNTRVGGVNLAGLTYHQAEDLLWNNLINYSEQPIFVQINGNQQELYAKDIDLEFDLKTALQDAFPEPSTDTPTAFFSIALNHLKTRDISLPTQFDEVKLTDAVYELGAIKKLKEPEIIFENGYFSMNPGISGEAITDDSLTLLSEHFSNLERNSVVIYSEPQNPEISDADVQAVADLANEIGQKELILRAGNVQISEKIGENPDWLNFELKNEEENSELALHAYPVYMKFGGGLVAGDTIGPTYEILLNQDAIEAFVTQNIISRMSNHAENIYLSLNNEGDIEVQGFLKDGYALNTEMAAKLIVENFNSGIFENELPVSIQPGRIIDNTGLNLGIKTTLAVGESDFSHSDANRINNVKVGLSRFQNILIPPGGVFNYADYIGPVDAAHGFLPGWVIKNRTRLELEYGGGICQTSTTLFRAAFYAGLPILERHPHGYDVSYYRWPAPGLDASVYVPYSSMKFENDTPGYILIQQAVNTATNRAYVWIYGTDDGRQISVSGPNVYGKYWASSSIEVPSTDLAAGERTLSHGAVAGFQSDWFRTVIHADGREEKYTVHSSYSAVPATYSVGQ